MATKNRVGGTEAVTGFMHNAQLSCNTNQDTPITLQVSAKAGDKWRLTKVVLPVSFQIVDDTPEIHIKTIGAPFYKAYRPEHGTQFSYDTVSRKLFIEGYLNKGRGDPYVICLSR
ncbi:hypothetical protein H0A66_06065 [Alcaligenaceae bacterium]|nr:hypothetical protein [Alcaligenaceae bacterium]